MFDIPYVLKVVFYRSEIGNEPVREWLKGLPREDKRKIGEDIKTAQIGWPLGMPLIRKTDKDLWEAGSRVETQRIVKWLRTVGVGFALLNPTYLTAQKRAAP